LPDLDLNQNKPRRLCQQGRRLQVGRGLYRRPDADVTEHTTLVTVSKRFPNGQLKKLAELLDTEDGLRVKVLRIERRIDKEQQRQKR
jgi:hypothetical protein